MKRIVLIGLMVASSAFAAKPKAPTAEDYGKTVEAKMIAEGQDRIVNRLNDPESARFRNVFISPKGRAICGEVNAKNSMGGYVGFRRFISAKDRAGVEDDGSYFADSNWSARCVKDELEGDPPKQ
ncbi:MAG TPA: hypothetical protein VFW00_07075 [Rhodocyclaceae bacterium]|nr:hypothetical protein [Rhodocyclaceae bacterium]